MPAKTKNISFEEAITQLEEITNQLQNGSLSLDASVKAYEKGMKLSELCTKMLNIAEGKLASIERNENGELEQKKIELADSELGTIRQNRLFQ